VDRENNHAFVKWKAAHQPFHWFVQFYGIMSNGGFDVIIGNPPYVEYSKVRRAYQVRDFATESCGNLYAMCAERSVKLLGNSCRFGFIVQAPIVSTQRMAAVRSLMTENSDILLYSTYDDRPSKLFDGMHHCRLAIVLLRSHERRSSCHVFTTRYHKWYLEERPNLFPMGSYFELPGDAGGDLVPKFRCEIERSALRKLSGRKQSIGHLISAVQTDHRIYYKITGVGHWFTFTTKPPEFWRDGVEGGSTRENSVSFRSALLRDTVFCCLWSTLHYWVYQARTNCRDFNPSDLQYLPLPEAIANGLPELGELARRTDECLEENSKVGTASYSVGGGVQYERFRPKLAKPIIDDIDTVLARHYGFSEEELDFLINYDIKYRMGGGAEDEDE